MENNTLNKLWYKLQKEQANDPNGNYLTDEASSVLKKDISDFWLEKSDYDPEKIFYIDPRMSNYLRDELGYIRQPITLKDKDYPVGSKFKLNECGTLRLGITWKSRCPCGVHIFGYLDQFPDKTITPNDSDIIENDELIATKTNYQKDSNGNRIKAKAIDIDVAQLKKLPKVNGRNQIHLALSTFTPFISESDHSDDILEVAFFVQSFSKNLSQLSAADRVKSLTESPIYTADMVFWLNGINTSSNQTASVNVDSMDMVVHDHPFFGSLPEALFKKEWIVDVYRRSEYSIDLKSMLEIVIPEENKTPYPDKADVVVTDRTRLASPKKILNPNTDLQQIKDLLMI